MCFPYSFDDQQEFLDALDSKMATVPSVYYKREHFADSYERRRVDLLTITSNDRMAKGCTEPLSHPHLFPSSGNQSTAQLFNADKKVVLLTARVHPGETPASYAMQGTIELLTDPIDPVAIELRRLFVFKVVPMINPDGVSRGHFRTDCHLQDLNRYYDDPTPQMHSPVFAIKQLLSYLDQDKRICFFCDYHSHGLPRNCYFYGNFLKYQLQVESKAFAKLMELTCPEFTASDCDFSLKSMGFKTFKKDRQSKTKVGCSRVAAFRSTLLVHCFTLEIGYHGLVNRNPGEVIEDNADSNDSCSDMDIQVSTENKASNNSYFGTSCYYRFGRNLLEALLDLYGKHPASPLARSQFRNIEAVRVEIAEKIKKDYVKTEQNVEGKMRAINQLIGEHYSQKGFQMQADLSETVRLAKEPSTLRLVNVSQNMPIARQDIKTASIKAVTGSWRSVVDGKTAADDRQSAVAVADRRPVVDGQKTLAGRSKFGQELAARVSQCRERKSKDLPTLKLVDIQDYTASKVKLKSMSNTVVEKVLNTELRAQRSNKLQPIEPRIEDCSDPAMIIKESNLKIITPKVVCDHDSSTCRTATGRRIPKQRRQWRSLTRRRLAKRSITASRRCGSSKQETFCWNSPKVH